MKGLLTRWLVAATLLTATSAGAVATGGAGVPGIAQVRLATTGNGAAATLARSSRPFQLQQGTGTDYVTLTQGGGSASLTVGSRNTPPLQLGAGLTITLNKSTALQGNSVASAAFDRAAQFYMDRFADPVNVIINADFSSLGSNILGQTSSTTLLTSGTAAAGYDLVRNAMVADQTPSGDITDSLPTSSSVSFSVPTGMGVGGMSLTQANALALGFSRSTPTDASITFNSNFAFDFNPDDGITAGTIDFVGVATHEIGHALGFISEVDHADFLVNANQTNDLMPTPLDLFRLQPGDGAIDFTGSNRLLTPGGSPVSYLGPSDGEAAMSTGAYTGDGRQASHWKDNQGIGIMDPTFAYGELGVFTSTDLRAFDLIGWDMVPVPEPASLALVGLALIGLAAARRRA